MRNTVRFLLGNEPRELGGIDPTLTVLEYLRQVEGRCGTKEGCAEGDCGACTVVLGELDRTGRKVFRAVNSCIQFVSTLEGKQLLTVEDLKQPDGALHPVQQTMCEHHASQCGFCTPGFVMSLYANWQNGVSEDRAALKDTLAGNLCRCTGYGPILDAAEALSEKTPSAQQQVPDLDQISPDETVQLEGNGKRCFIPRSAAELAALLTEHPDAHLIAGLTDVGLWVTKQRRELPLLIQIAGIPDLNTIEETDAGIRFGAAVTLADAHPVLAKHFPAIDGLMRRFAARQIRNAGTLCGNIANGSPIGDGPPALIALDATLHLRRGSTRREILLEDFFIDYGKQDLAPGEFVEAVHVPYLQQDEIFACHKLSKRFDQDISAVMAGFKLDIQDGIVRSVRLCYGGMAGVPKRATGAEQALTGQPWVEASVREAMTAMVDDFMPLTDMRASADYRMTAAQNLLLRTWFEHQQGSAVTDLAEASP